MAVKPFKEEEWNFFKFASIVHIEFPKMLRLAFETLWNRKVAPLPGYQVWDDTPEVRKLFLALEGGKTAIPIDKSFKDWDCTALFRATIYSKAFGISTNLPTDKKTQTLSDQFIREKRPNPFHLLVSSSTRSQDETITLAIDQVRRLRNILCHMPQPRITKLDFDFFVQLVKDAFAAVGFPCRINDTDCLEEEFQEVVERNMAVVEENFRSLKKKTEELIKGNYD